jgi:HAD superfamily hydrolase (TIGR01509 family)
MLKSVAIRDIDLIIFDCDGVVVDSEVLACTCLSDALRLHRLDLGIDEIFELFLGRSFSVVEEYYRRVIGKPLPDAFRTDLHDRLSRSFAASLTSMPYVVDVLTRLDRSYCLASSSDAERIRLSLAVTGLARFFGERVYPAAMVARGKPAPDLYLFIAARMRAVTPRVLVVEDSVSGIVAGKAAGMKVWGFTGGSHCAGRDIGRQLLAAGADRVFDSMAEFMDV